MRPLRKGSVAKRMFAKLIDAVVAGVTTWSFWRVMPLPFASFIGMTWFCLTDWSGSPGKWLLRLKAVTLEGAPLSAVASLKRNLLLGMPTFLRALLVSGWLGAQGDDVKGERGLLALVSLAVYLREFIGLVKQPESRRWGDIFARSRVVDRSRTER